MRVFLFLFVCCISNSGFSQSSDSLKSSLEVAAEVYTKFEALDQSLDSLTKASEKQNAELFKRIEERVKASNNHDQEKEALRQAEELKNQSQELLELIKEYKRQLADSISNE